MANFKQPAQWRDLHKLFFNEQLIDAHGDPIVDIKLNHFVFPMSTPTPSATATATTTASTTTATSGSGTEKPSEVDFHAYTISAALVNGQTGLRAKKQFGPDDITYDRHPKLRALVPRCYTVVCTAHQPTADEETESPAPTATATATAAAAAATTTAETEAASASSSAAEGEGDGLGGLAESAAEDAKAAPKRRPGLKFTIVGEIKGMPKFTGLNTDEEDESTSPNQHSEEHMCNRGLINQASHFLVTTKANGKSAVLTAFKFESKLFYILGSKNTHSILDATDLSTLVDQIPDKHPLVKGIAVVIQNHLLQVKNLNKLEELHDILLTHTLCGEYEDGEHIVPREEPPTISWFALLPKRGEMPGASTDRCAALKRIQGFGLPTVEFALHPKSDLVQEFVRLRRTPHMEGAVIDFMDQQKDGTFTVVETVKFKSVWYILTRCVREIMRGALSVKRIEGMSNEERISVTMQRVTKTLHTRSRDFLHLSPPTLAAYEALYKKFINWYVGKGYTGLEINTKGMAVMWTSFLKETHTSDVIDETEVDANAFENDLSTTKPASPNTTSTKPSEPAPPTKSSVEPHASAKTKVTPESSAAISTSSSSAAETETASPTFVEDSLPRLLVTTHGVPADGKTTRGTLIVDMLNKRGIRSVLIEQDQYGGDGAQTLKVFTSFASNPSYKVIFLSRCNSCRKQYFKYLEVARSKGLSVVGIMAQEIMSEKLLLVCMSSILTRQNHGTMNASDANSLANYIMVLLSFRTVFETPKVGTDVDVLHTFKALNDFDVDKSVLDFVKGYLAEVKRTPWKATPKPLDVVKQKTMMGSINYQDHRVVLEELCSLLVEQLIADRESLPSTSKVAAPAPTNSSNTRTMYFAVKVPEVERNKLRELCETHAAAHSVSLSNSVWNGEHLTLLHRSSSGTCSIPWNSFVNAASSAVRLTVQVHTIVLEPSGVVGMKATVKHSEPSAKCFGSTGDAADATELVASGIPHITGFLPKGVKPFQTVEYIRKANPALVFALPPSQVVTFTAKVTACS
ncbi:hypothetical protein Pelo_11580 [Pelomyxa schiedti]|nr:hypothetical protein Pelo_11580 [Pelomyxa schiedti]